MSYLVILTFDLNNTNSVSNEIYGIINSQLANIGLRRSIISNTNNIVNLPNNTYVGEFKGANAQRICDDLLPAITNIFQENRLTSQIFLAAGGDSWAWRSRRFNFTT